MLSYLDVLSTYRCTKPCSQADYVIAENIPVFYTQFDHRRKLSRTSMSFARSTPMQTRQRSVANVTIKRLFGDYKPTKTSKDTLRT
jgi:hypothetical protein